jgi:polar amino acid transport system permease protein
MELLAIHVDWHLIGQRIIQPDGAFWRALGTTVYIAVIAQCLGVLLGLLSALAGLSRLRVLRFVSFTYVLILRGTPVIVQIFFMYFGANLFLGFDLFPRTVDLGLIQVGGAVVAGTAALALNEGAYMSEIIRAGITSIDRGQMEAAKSVGMTYRLAMRRIVLPQAARVIVPPLGNEFNNMLKTTSLLAFIGVYELFQDADVHYSTTFKPVEYFAAVAFWYLVLTTIWSLIQVQIERRLAVSEREEGESWFVRILGTQYATPRGVR